MHKKILLIFMCLALALTACMGTQETRRGNGENQGRSGTAGILGQTQAGKQAKIIIDQVDAGTAHLVNQNGVNYLSIQELFTALGYNVENEEGQIIIGFTDPIYQINPLQNQATIEDKQVQLGNQVIYEEGQSYLSVESLKVLLTDTHEVTWGEQSLIINTIEDGQFPVDVDDEWEHFEQNEDQAEPAMSNAKADSLIRTARRYLGVRYVFGAPSGVTSRFDCSSFTQFVYYKHGIRLPRLARSQSRVGRSVSVANLQKGDLLFFAVPGRFRSNRTVGHVAIYMGNGYMIHSAPKKVQIDNVAKSSYWRSVYLGAKRVG
jgi:hypothetical protein